jgi:methionyl-tRNA formyltransferase
MKNNMTAQPDWWRKPRIISIVVDNESWILPYAQRLVEWCGAQGDTAALARRHADIGEGGVAFYLGCVHITPPEILARNHRNLVVHESALPEGRGFAPMSWQILAGRNDIPICLLEATEEVDGGPVYYRDCIHLSGSELCNEWRVLQGEKTVELCQRFLLEKTPPQGTTQAGGGSVYKRRRPEDSRLDPAQTLAAQFDLLRIADNEEYPVFFELRGQRYILRIEKDGEKGEG